MSLEHILLNKYYPDYRENAPLPPELMIMVMGMLKETDTDYYPNGSPYLQESYINRTLNEELKIWQSDGIIRSVEYYAGGKREGPRRCWWANGKLMLEEHYVNGKRHGESKEWWNNGSLHKIELYVNGKRHGESKEWWNNGSLSSQHTYVNGTLTHRKLCQ